MIKTIVAVLLICLPIGVAFSDEMEKRGKLLFENCVACHGDNGAGKKTFGAPNITGQEEWYLERQLTHFKKGIRGTHVEDIYGAQMLPITSVLKGESDIKAVAKYVASLPVYSHQDLIKGNPEAGKQSYALCASCHGDKAQGNKLLNAPQLANLQTWYTVRQLKNFKKGKRGGSLNDIYGLQMRPMAMTLQDEQAMQNIAAYIATLKPSK